VPHPVTATRVGERVVPSDGRSETPAVYTKEMSFGKQRSLVSKTFLPRGVRLRLELVSTRDPAHVPVVIRGTTTRRTTHRAAGISRQQNMTWWSQSTRDPAHVPVVIRRTTTRRPTPSAASNSRQQNTSRSQRETQLMSLS
jgi:hypothetical protein